MSICHAGIWRSGSACWAGSFLAAWLYFVLLERTDNRQARALHWLILIGGFFLLIASRLYIDIRVYGISF